MLSIILMIQMRYVVIPLFVMLYGIWGKMAISSSRNKEQKELHGAYITWYVITFLAICVLLVIGMYHGIVFCVKNW